MDTTQPVQARLLGIVALIKADQLKVAGGEIESLERALYAPAIGGRGYSLEPERSIEVSTILDSASGSLASGDAEGALIWLEQALTVWARTCNESVNKNSRFGIANLFVVMISSS